MSCFVILSLGLCKVLLAVYANQDQEVAAGQLLQFIMNLYECRLFETVFYLMTL